MLLFFPGGSGGTSSRSLIKIPEERRLSPAVGWGVGDVSIAWGVLPRHPRFSVRFLPGTYLGGGFNLQVRHIQGRRGGTFLCHTRRGVWLEVPPARGRGSSLRSPSILSLSLSKNNTHVLGEDLKKEEERKQDKLSSDSTSALDVGLSVRPSVRGLGVPAVALAVVAG